MGGSRRGRSSSPSARLARTTASNVKADDCRRFDLVVYRATARGGDISCDATLASSLLRDRLPHPEAQHRLRAPPALCEAAAAGWAQHWWGLLSVTVPERLALLPWAAAGAAVACRPALGLPMRLPLRWPPCV